MKILVTGASGFIGGHLVESLLKKGNEVHSLTRKESSFLNGLGDKSIICIGDITDREYMKSLIKEIRPEIIYHLAAQSFPKVSWENPAETFNVNVIGTINLLEAVRLSNLNPLIINFGSSAEYAPSKDSLPIDENWHLGPLSPYGISKVAQFHISILYNKRYQLRIIHVRPFFIIGERKEGDVCSDFAKKIVEVEGGNSSIIKIGNMEIERDFLDIRDCLSALDTICKSGKTGEVYNICSGKGYSLRFILDSLKSIGESNTKEEVDSSLIRPIDEKSKVGDPGKLKSLGWFPNHEIEKSLKNILDYWKKIK